MPRILEENFKNFKIVFSPLPKQKEIGEMLKT